jgi:phosphate:Na+ symporter
MFGAALLTSATSASMLILDFVRAGDASVAQAIAMCMGVHVGSTLQSHMVSLNLQAYGPALLAMGYCVNAASKPASRAAGAGDALFNLGLTFVAMTTVSAGLAPLKTHPPFLAVLAAVDSPLLAALAAVALTVALQSSNTVVSLAIVLVQEGSMTPATCCAFVVGANVGTCITTLINASASGRAENRHGEAVATAIAYLGTKTAGAAVALPLVPAAAHVMMGWSGDAGSRAAAAQLAANFNTIFNAGIALASMPFVDGMAVRLLAYTRGGASRGGAAGGERGEHPIESSTHKDARGEAQAALAATAASDAVSRSATGDREAGARRRRRGAGGAAEHSLRIGLPGAAAGVSGAAASPMLVSQRDAPVPRRESSP